MSTSFSPQRKLPRPKTKFSWHFAPPPQEKPKTPHPLLEARNCTGMEVFSTQRAQKSQAPIELAQSICGRETFYGHEAFSDSFSGISGNRKRWRQTGSRQSTPYRQYGPETEIRYRPLKLHGFPEPAQKILPRLLGQCRFLSKRKPDTQIQYRHCIADTETIADAIFPDAASETSRDRTQTWRGGESSLILHVLVLRISLVSSHQ